MFTTYNTLIAKNKKTSRLDQLIEWCGGDKPEEFDGLIMVRQTILYLCTTYFHYC